MGDSDLPLSRDIVLRLLRGEIDPVEDHMLVMEDIVLFAVARLDEADTGWLLHHLADTAWPYERRADVAAMMVRHRAEAFAALGDDSR
ncbi:hypothetical protein [Nocardia flavorosea]|uniref:Uncharacterized protein n=1 Tax=Nocardia flavorosea TaxID=53429 RepID=A0A846YD95_9NOCA|nr:hypothetical protein [Nocardia flavorosea]NKY55730.1 hypothetical protein [Nocardia flavorosea]